MQNKVHTCINPQRRGFQADVVVFGIAKCLTGVILGKLLPLFVDGPDLFLDFMFRLVRQQLFDVLYPEAGIRADKEMQAVVKFFENMVGVPANNDAAAFFANFPDDFCLGCIESFTQGPVI